MMKNLLLKVKKEKGITLVALVVTIIVLLILAGIAISLTIGNNGLFSRSKTASDVHSKEAAREKLEIALSNLELDKNTREEYDSNGYLEEELGKEGITVIGNIAIVDEWQFEIDKSVPKIILDIGKGQESNNIKINAEGDISKDYVTANVIANIDYEGTISNVSINGKEIEVPEKQDGIYTINEEVEENGTYTILAKDEEDNYKIKKVQITELTENMEIWNKGDLVIFREKVNSGRTFEKRTVRVMADIDLQGTNADQWVPIGNDTTQFKGMFEGNKRTISNLYMDTDQYQYVGLFYRLNALATVQNIILENVQISNKVICNNSYTGGIVGNSNGKIINSGVNSGNIEYTSTENASGQNWHRVGGIIGCCYSNEVNGCYNNATIKANVSNATSVQVEVGGLIGKVETSAIVNCYNTGNIEAVGEGVFVGGIIGLSTKLIANNLYNIGNFRTNASGYQEKGGIVGQEGWSAESAGGSILNCYYTKTTEYAYKQWPNITSTLGAMEKEEIKKINDKLGDAFTNDIQNPDGTWKYNNGYPILKWQLENE